MPDADIHVSYVVKQSTSANPRLAAPGRITAAATTAGALEPYVRIFGRDRVQTLALPFGQYVRQMG
jgi:hypothetical protein